MLQKSLRDRLRNFEIKAFDTVKCAAPSCSTRTKPWHGYIGHFREFYCSGQWCCGPECLEEASLHIICRTVAQPERISARRHRLPLGLLLVSQGLISHDVVKEALEAQRQHGTGRIGVWLRKLGGVTEQQIAEAVAKQWSCGMYPLDKHPGYLEHAQLLPHTLLRCLQMLPVHYSTQTKSLHVCFSDVIDYSALYAIEQILQRQTVSCIAKESSVVQGLARITDMPRENEHLFEGEREAREIARECRRHVLASRGHDIRMVRCREYLWVRILSRKPIDLLFRNRWASAAARGAYGGLIHRPELFN